MMQVMGKAHVKHWARVAWSSRMAGMHAKHCGGGQVGGVRVKSGWGRKRGTHRWRNLCLLAISPCPLVLISRSMLSIRSVVIIGACAGIMSSSLTRSGGPQQSGHLGFNRNWMGRERCEERNKNTECPCEREVINPVQSTDTMSAPVPPTPKASGTLLLDDPALVLSPLA